MVSGELQGNYAWQVYLNGQELSQGQVQPKNIDQSTQLQVAVKELLTDTINRLTIERTPAGSAGLLLLRAGSITTLT